MLGAVPTIVFFHAHPDDEVLLTGGTMAMAAHQDQRVVLVIATNGEHGDTPDDLGAGETLVERRRGEAERSAAVLGIARVAWLGYGDSGMTGWEQNEHATSFWKADVEDAARRLAEILVAEEADVVVFYDWHGGYGHPDHVQAHRVGRRAAEIAGTPRALEATMNRDAMSEFAEQSGQDDFDPNAPADDGNPFGTPEAELHWAVDVSEYLAQKRAALACHASQVSDAGQLLALPDDFFAKAFGTEWYMETTRQPGLSWGWPFGAAEPPG